MVLAEDLHQGDDAEAVQYLSEGDEGLTDEEQSEISSGSSKRDGGNDGG